MEQGTAAASLDSVISACCAELLASLFPGGAAAAGDQREILSFIDLGGTDLRATLAARAPFAAIEASHPRRRKEAGDDQVLDWAAEILNQIAGRVANRLSARGVETQLGLPGTFVASELELFCARGEDGRAPLVFEGHGVRVYASVATVAAHAAASPSAATREGGAAAVDQGDDGVEGVLEGGLVLF